MKIKIAFLSLYTITGKHYANATLFLAMRSVEERRGDADTLSEEEGLPRCMFNDYCTNGLKIKSISIRSEPLKLKWKHKHRIHPKG